MDYSKFLLGERWTWTILDHVMRQYLQSKFYMSPLPYGKERCALLNGFFTFLVYLLSFLRPFHWMIFFFFFGSICLIFQGSRRVKMS